MIFSQPFDDACHDFEKMWRFLQKDYAQKKDRFVWLFSRLGDWKYGLWNEKKYITGYSDEANGLYEKLGPCKHIQWFHKFIWMLPERYLDRPFWRSFLHFGMKPILAWCWSKKLDAPL